MPGKFPLGQTVLTPNAQSTLHPEDIRQCLGRHASGEWGEIDNHDRRANESALIHGARLFSVYHDRDKTKFWIITEADRSATTILLPEDY